MIWFLLTPYLYRLIVRRIHVDILDIQQRLLSIVTFGSSLKSFVPLIKLIPSLIEVCIFLWNRQDKDISVDVAMCELSIANNIMDSAKNKKISDVFQVRQNHVKCRHSNKPVLALIG